ncbi:PREDICTED: uncharacterized protein LOC109157029 [Ipomoea nil]|uniref:uncharacterized protein LOC109157029 n=1 Tax=Ipomoea nil TaxID=35883 RepID=UPI000901C222|nr:PREDICTED: uncharacterized protein LOC109157029 [Ipomoea nil]
MGEHHSDKPEHLDEDGDAVMEVEGDPGGTTDGKADDGAGGRDFHRVLKHLIKTHKPCLVGLVEPKASGSHATEIYSKFGYEECVRVQEGGEEPWHLAIVYCSPEHHLRRRLWDEFQANKRVIPGPWFVAEDFNAVTCQAETLIYNAYSTPRSAKFVDWINSEELIDLGFCRPRLTWTRGTGSSSAKGARLGRAMCNMEWRQRFPEAHVKHLPRGQKWHSPLLLHTLARNRGGRSGQFKLQAAWFTNSNFSGVINRAWNPLSSWQVNIGRVQADLVKWNKEIFGNITNMKNILLSRIEGIQRNLAVSFHRGLWKLEKKLQGELKEVLYQEELMWFQRSRED